MPVLGISIFSLLLIFSLSLLHSRSSTSDSDQASIVSRRSIPTALGLPQLPRFAYLISGTRGEVPQIKRLFQVVYHPRNYYVLHLDFDASDDERLELAKFVKSTMAVRRFRNAMVVGKADLITHKGPTAITATLHAAAILLKQSGENQWDWFINLNCWDYPLISQDDLLHIFSYLPRDLNFLDHTSELGWKEHQRARPIIIDPGLYHSKKSGVFWAKEKRSLPASFKLFTGSEWVVLTKSFIDFCIWGFDNLPRTLLMYYANFLLSSEGYFHTVVCNHKNYQNTTVNHDLHFVKWDNQHQQPINLTLEHYDEMVSSGAPFAHRFSMNDPVLEKIDRVLLGRLDGRFAPGRWCIGNTVLGKDPCELFGSPDAIKPSANYKRLEKLLLQLLDPVNFRSRQCK